MNVPSRRCRPDRISEAMLFPANARQLIHRWYLRANVRLIKFSRSCVRVYGEKLAKREEDWQTLPNTSEPRTTSVEEEEERGGGKEKERKDEKQKRWWKREGRGGGGRERRRGRGRRDKGKVSNAVDGTCIRWIAASFENSHGKTPSCSPM